MLKKTVLLLVLFLIVLFIPVSSLAAPYNEQKLALKLTPAVEDLIGAGVLSREEAKKLFSVNELNFFFLLELSVRTVEKLTIEEGWQIATASSDKSYKDVSFGDPNYKTVQKAIALGILPPGNRRELLSGGRGVDRYKMVEFLVFALEKAKGSALRFEQADLEQAFDDVPADHHAAPALRKLIWLGVLSGGPGKQFHGERSVDRQEMARFLVDLIKAVSAKAGQGEALTEAEAEPGLRSFMAGLMKNFVDRFEGPRGLLLSQPTRYGLKGVVDLKFGVSQLSSAGNQAEFSSVSHLSLYYDQPLTENFSAYLAVSTGYNYLNQTTTRPYVEETYLMMKKPGYLVSLGRSYIYQGFSPFGNSIFVDTLADALTVVYTQKYFKLNLAAGRLAWLDFDPPASKFGLASLVFDLPGRFDWLDVALGGASINDLPNRSFSAALPANVTESYAGLSAKLFHDRLNFTAEFVSLAFSTSAEAPNASQYALTYTADDYSYSWTLGYQTIGDDYYLSSFTAPTAFLYGEQGSASWLLRGRAYQTNDELMGFDAANIVSEGVAQKTVIKGYYIVKILGSTDVEIDLVDLTNHAAGGRRSSGLTVLLSTLF